MKYYINGALMRTSDREYTHAVVSDGKPGAVGGVCLHCCCGRYDLAQKGTRMKKEPVTGFRCYICGKVFPDQTERATPCGYDRFGHATCKACCEECHNMEPFPCYEYDRRKRRERREAGRK